MDRFRSCRWNGRSDYRSQSLARPESPKECDPGGNSSPDWRGVSLSSSNSLSDFLGANPSIESVKILADREMRYHVENSEMIFPIDYSERVILCQL